MFQKGQSGNPAGRPKKNRSLTEILDRRLGKVGKIELAEILIRLAKNEDLPALKYIFDRIDGKPTITEKTQGNVTLEITKHDEIAMMSREEVEQRIKNLMTKERDAMTPEQRRERAQFYLNGLPNT